jgi:aspartyl-tRNA(Asn)/glutamyl-tRNA(Gln) amidotransferase subunit C
MSTLDTNDVKKIAFLARLGIEEQDIPDYVTNLSNILDMVEQLNAVDTKGVKPMAHPFDAVQRLRIDEVTEINDRDNLQANAPEIADGLYLVPKVLE